MEFGVLLFWSLGTQASTRGFLMGTVGVVCLAPGLEGFNLSS